MKRPLLAKWAAVWGLAVAGTACSNALTARDPSLAHTPGGRVEWNLAHTDVGRVQAVAENGDTLCVFSDRGVSVFVAGALAATIPSTSTWTGAAAVPSSDRASTWIIGIDSEGALWRVRDRARLERVSDRFAILHKRALSAYALGGTTAVFHLGSEFAIADGRTVHVAPMTGARSMAAGGAWLAFVGDAGVTKVSLDLRTARTYALENAAFSAIDLGGRLYVSTNAGVYTEDNSGQLVLAYRSDAIHGLVASGARVWAADGTKLVAFDGGASGVRTELLPDGSITARATLTASPSGDVWAIDGTLTRVSVAALPSAPPAMSASPAAAQGAPNLASQWASAVRPIFVESCATCHMPGGASGIDLAGAEAWRSKSDALRERVLIKKSMPPPGAPHALSEQSRRQIAAWLDAAAPVHAH